MALEHGAVVMNAGSENHTPGSSLRHASADTPPSVMGISTDSPERLSVMVIESAMGSPSDGTDDKRFDATSVPEGLPQPVQESSRWRHPDRRRLRKQVVLEGAQGVCRPATETGPVRPSS